MGAQLLALVAGAFLGPARPPCTGRRCASPAAQIDGRTKFEQSFEVKPADVLQVEEDHLGIAYTPSSQLLWAEQIVETVPWLRERVESLSPDEIATIAEHDMVLSPLTTYLRPSAQAQVRLALEVAFLTHRGQTRRSGEPYITHPVAVTIILAKTQMDKATLCAGLLHDTVEDTALTFDEVQSLFGPTVRKIVEGETKVSKLPKMVRAQIDEPAEVELDMRTKAEEQVENLRSMFIAMAEDWRIVVVKLADRLHNMRTLQYMPVEKRVRIARETLEIFAPLAHRLGMWTYKTELADLSFKYTRPAQLWRNFAQFSGAILRNSPTRLSTPRLQVHLPARVPRDRPHDQLEAPRVPGRARVGEGAGGGAIAGRRVAVRPRALRRRDGAHQVDL